MLTKMQFCSNRIQKRENDYEGEKCEGECTEKNNQA